jgi:hypothetical protein
LHLLLVYAYAISKGDTRAFDRSVSGSMPQQYVFGYDRVFSDQDGQEDIYSQCVETVVSSVLHGYNGSIIAYGQTGTGKTHTIEGNLVGNDRGIIPRVAEQVFSMSSPNMQGIMLFIGHTSLVQIFEHIQQASESGSQFLVRVSFLQIYNEKIHDLLVSHTLTSPFVVSLFIICNESGRMASDFFLFHRV